MSKTSSMRVRFLGILGLVLCIPVSAQSVTWTRVEELPPSDITNVELYGTTLYAAGSDTVFLGAALGTSWTSSNLVGAGAARIYTVIPAGGALWAGSFGNGVFRSLDDGQSWNGLNNGLNGLGAQHISGFAARDDTLFAATEGAGVFALDLATSTTWTDFNDGLPVFTAGNVSSIILHGTTLLAPAAGNGFVYRYPEGATAWEEIAVRPPLLPGFFPTDIYGDGTNLLVTNGSSVFRSTDDGQSWTRAGTGLTSGNAVFFAGDGSTVYAVVDFSMSNTHEFFSSQDGGESFLPMEPVQDAFVEEIEVAGDRLFAAQSDGLWWTIPSMTDTRPASWGKMKARFTPK